tara:strand:+ start:1048 stop:1806 length:759 start_codon:yes stop_codon:yes gene_type:complete
VSEKKKATPPVPVAKRKRKRRKKKATIETGDPTKAEQQRRAVFRGFLRYVERHGVSLREVWDSERINDDDTSPYIRDVISWSAFSKSASTGRWRVRRDEHWTEVKRKVLEHAQTEAVQAEIAEIGQLEAVRTIVLDRIVGNTAAGIMPAIPKSLEGAVGAFVQLDKRIASKRDVVVEQTAAAAARPSAHKQVAGGGPLMIGVDETPLSDEEVIEMSRALAAHRAGIVAVEPDSVELPSILTAEEVGPEAVEE